MRLIDFFDRGASLYPERACLVDETGPRSYRLVERRSHQIANGLPAVGLSRDAKVAVYSPNDARAFECILGTLRAGRVWLSINARSGIDEIADILSLCDCEWLFYHSMFEAHLEQIRRRVPSIRGAVSLDAGSASASSLDAWAASFPAETRDIMRAPEDPAAIVSTGGTTGRPKGVMLSHRTFETMIATFAVCMPWREPPVHLVAAPITHGAGALCFALMPFGATNVILPKVDVETILESIERYRVNVLFLPPTVIYMMLAHPRVREFDYSSLRHFVYAAAPMSVEKLKEAIRTFGPVMTQTYGQAEAPMICTFLPPEEHLIDGDPAHERRLWSCGKSTLFTQLAILDDGGKRLGSGERGEIVVRGNLVMSGYYKNKEETEEASRFGWHHTGDIGSIDEDGYVYIRDRKKDMIISGGFNIFPSEIEQVILSHPAVLDCAVVGVPDEKWGEAVKALVEVRANQRVSEAELIALCKERLAGMKTPKSLEFWDALPRSAVGKVLKREIRRRYWEGRSRMV